MRFLKKSTRRTLWTKRICRTIIVSTEKPSDVAGSVAKSQLVMMLLMRSQLRQRPTPQGGAFSAMINYNTTDGWRENRWTGCDDWSSI